MDVHYTCSGAPYLNIPVIVALRILVTNEAIELLFSLLGYTSVRVLQFLINVTFCFSKETYMQRSCLSLDNSTRRQSIHFNDHMNISRHFLRSCSRSSLTICRTFFIASAMRTSYKTVAELRTILFEWKRNLQIPKTLIIDDSPRYYECCITDFLFTMLLALF